MDVHIDSLVGPTHFFGGLSEGNLASLGSSKTSSSPKKAALEGLDKMKLIHDLGITQLVFPPHKRPFIPHQFLSQDMKTKEEDKQWEFILKTYPEKVAQLYSSSFMWMANSATVTPYWDSYDGLSHITPANLSSFFHRAIEAPFTHHLLQQCFHSVSKLVIHPPVPSDFPDEGAANHLRIHHHSKPEGCHLIVYNKSSQSTSIETNSFPCRQHFKASQFIYNHHQLKHFFHLQQHPKAVQSGVFHNDVICLSEENTLISHTLAFKDTEQLAYIENYLQKNLGLSLKTRIATEDQFSLKDCLSSYFYNSQLISSSQLNTRKDNLPILVCPTQSLENKASSRFIKQLTEEGVIGQVIEVPVTQSMKNGGGPACLRLRVPLDNTQIKQLNPKFILTDKKYKEIQSFIDTHYLEQLDLSMLRDPNLKQYANQVLEKLYDLFELPSFNVDTTDYLNP